MSLIYLTGSTGFVGTSFIKYFDKKNVVIHKRGENFNIDSAKIVIHLAGKAHDLKKTTTSLDYYQVNTEITKHIFDSFLYSNAKVFITLSSVKAVADELEFELNEQHHPNPTTHYGKSKLLAEQYILSKDIPIGKQVYILRPCMIHGPGNKGNLNLLFNFVSQGFPWPLGLFENSRSYLSIENLCFIVRELIERNDIPSGIYNVADDVAMSTNQIINLIGESNRKKAIILNFNKTFIRTIANLGDFLNLPFNSERLQKLTESYVVSNKKIKFALGKSLPLSSKEGFIRTFQSFVENA